MRPPPPTLFSSPDPPERPGDPPPPGGHVRPVLLGGPGGFLMAFSALAMWEILAGGPWPGGEAAVAAAAALMGGILAPPIGLLAGTCGAELARGLHRRRGGAWDGRVTSFVGAALGGTAAAALPYAVAQLV